MGVVYKAADIKLERIVALKFVAPHLLLDADVRSRFNREAKAAASLSQPNICTIYEIDESDRGLFIAMEFIEGESLERKIQRGPLALDEALDIGSQVAQGLGAAHQKCLSHRDIKPQNVIVTADGRAVILDFGLAQLTGYSRLTLPGAATGTIAYMSPEQAQGEGTDHRTDIWSLGALLYEMITGRLPFLGDYHQAVIYSILTEQPPPITGLRTNVPLKLEWVVSKCLAKQRIDRYSSSEDLLTDLRTVRRECAAAARGTPLGSGSVLQPASTSGRTAPPQRATGERDVRLENRASADRDIGTNSEQLASRNRGFSGKAWVLGVSLALCLALALTTFLLLRAPQPAQEQPLRRFSITPEDLSPGEYANNVAISPNGRYIAYLTGVPARYAIWIHDISKDIDRQIQSVRDFPRHFWSSDSRFISFQDDGNLKAFSVETGEVRTICKAPPRFGGGTWSPDGKVIVFAAQRVRGNRTYFRISAYKPVTTVWSVETV